MSLRMFDDGLYLEHADEVSALTERRAGWLADRTCTPDDIAELEARVDAHVDALVLGGEPALDVTRASAWPDAPWSFYAWVAVACRSGRDESVRDALVELEAFCTDADDDAEAALLRRVVGDAIVHHAPEDRAEAIVGEIARAPPVLARCVRARGWAMITGIGAVSSVGLDAVTTCASIRAGLSRPDTLLEHEVLDREQQIPVGVTGHPITLVTHGFTGPGRWLQMAALALEDLARTAGLPGPDAASFWSTTQCVVVVPVLDPERFVVEPGCRSEPALTEWLLPPLGARVASFASLSQATVWCRGRIGVLEVVRLAAEHFRHRRYERVVVLAVDSLTDGTALSWLSAHGRLAHDDNPVGLAPGEGAVALLLEAPWAARTRQARALGWVDAITSSREATGPRLAERSPGEELASVMQAVLTASSAPMPYRGPTITDLNGEQWRANESGHARVRVPRNLLGESPVELPATCVGDIGAGMTALQLILACRSLARGYATTEHVLVTASDEYGHAGAAMLRKDIR